MEKAAPQRFKKKKNNNLRRVVVSPSDLEILLNALGSISASELVLDSTTNPVDFYPVLLNVAP